MAKLNYSRQREAILDFLCHTTSHPTAEEVYMYIRDEKGNDCSFSVEIEYVE